jgi:hypothetical protein
VRFVALGALPARAMMEVEMEAVLAMNPDQTIECSGRFRHLAGRH